MLLTLPGSFALLSQDTPDTHLTVFEDLGNMVADSAYIHVLVPVDMRNFSSTFRRANELLQEQFAAFHQRGDYRRPFVFRVYHMYSMQHLLISPNSSQAPKGYHEPSFSHRSNAAGISIAHQLRELEQQFLNLTSLLPQQSDVQHVDPHTLSLRQKRGVGIVIGLIAAVIAGALIGTYLGPYSQHQINALPLAKDLDLLLHIDDEHHQMVANLEKRVNAAFDVVHDWYQNGMPIANHMVIWNAIIRQMEHRLHQFTDFVSHLQDRRLSPTWFTHKQLLRIHDDVQKQAARNGLTPLPQHLSDYFQLDVSYVKNDHYITAIIHVPASTTPYTFKVYRYLPFPIPAAHGNVLMIRAREDIIAVGHDHHHRVFTQVQLNHCLRRYQKYICEFPLITNTNFSTSCVGSLMDHNHAGIQQHCSLETVPSQEMVFQTATNQFAIYSPETFTGRGKCLNGTSFSALISRISKVQVPSGCNLVLRNHILTVPVNIIAAGQPWVQNTKWDTLEVPRQLFENEIRRRDDFNRLFDDDNKIRSTIERQLNSSLQDLQDAHETVAKDAKSITTSISNHHYYIIALAGVALTLLFVLICCMCCRYCAPPAPYAPVIAAPTD